MRGVELVEPRSLSAALGLLDTDDATVRPFAGGTALMLMMKSGVFKPSRLVQLGAIEDEYRRVVATAAGGLLIGAVATLSTVEHAPDVIRLAPVITRSMKRLANVRVRNVARIGGALAHGDPHMDLPPILAALGGEVEVRGPAGERRIAIESLYAGYYETTLTQGELITGVVLPSQTGWASAYGKCTTRTHDDWPALGIAVSLEIDGAIIADARVMVSAATEKLTRLGSAEAILRGATIGTDVFARAAEAAANEAETIDDARGSAAYKTALLRVHAKRAFEEAVRNGAVR